MIVLVIVLERKYESVAFLDVSDGVNSNEIVMS